MMGVYINPLLNFLNAFSLLLGKFICLRLRSGYLLSLGLLDLLLLAALALILLLGIDVSLLQVSPVVLNIGVIDVEDLLGILDFLVDHR